MKTSQTGEKEQLLLNDEQTSALSGHQGDNGVLFMSTQGFAAVHSCRLWPSPSLSQLVACHLSELVVALSLAVRWQVTVFVQCVFVNKTDTPSYHVEMEGDYSF